MRLIGCLLLGVALATAGCATTKSPGEKGRPEEKPPIITPGQGLTGRVSLFNDSSRYAVVSFPIGTLPAAGSVLSVYRKGLKVGELKVNGPQMDNLVTADLVTGTCRAGDEARAQ